MNKQILSDGTLSLRAVEVTDVDTLMTWENDSAQWDTSNTAAPYNRKQLWDYAVNYTGDITAGSLRLIITETKSQASVGTVDIYDYNILHNRAFIGMYIAPEHRNKGYGKRAVEIGLNYACNYLGLKQVVAEVAAGNTASIATLTACGFVKCGQMRNWFRRGRDYADALLMQYIAD